MTYKMIYGTDTKSIEDYYSAVVVLVPDDMEGDELEEKLNEDFYSFEQQQIVTWDDTRDSFILAMRAEGFDNEVIARIILTVSDAIDNNDN
jgi:hypothetical protein